MRLTGTIPTLVNHIVPGFTCSLMSRQAFQKAAATSNHGPEPHAKVFLWALRPHSSRLLAPNVSHLTMKGLVKGLENHQNC